MNNKTQETNQQVIDRMEVAFVNNIENVDVLDTSVISPEERKVIINQINKVRNRKYTTGTDLVNYISHLADSLKLLQTV
tara:strand:- start:269 stop:505 length:237 start_codon:yes stop_codon:yes gene_type:complete